MRIAIVGAGAIGAFVGAALARGGADVHLLARGANLAALRERGIRVRSPRGDFHEHPPVTDDAREIGPVDVVFLGLKAHHYATAGPLLAPAHDVGDHGRRGAERDPLVVLPRSRRSPSGRRVEAVDPGGAVSRVIPPAQAVGCVVYCSTELEAPGVVRHVYGTRLTIGEPDGTRSERCVAFSEAMVAGGLKCPVVSTIRDDLWVKLMGNAVFNPLSALTRATMVAMCQDPPLRRTAATAMAEILEIARATGADPQVSIERRLTGAESVGEHRTSTLQDLEAGKALELEAVADAVVELADLTGVEAPTLRTIAAAGGMLASTLGLREEPTAAATQPARGG